ncbi:MAG: purine-binding chemotaxis protein CheW [Anaerolineaceae bacterium]|nr:purine-binding chemotaxis protein CheW [Anaerolineaceae bacterium]
MTAKNIPLNPIAILTFHMNDQYYGAFVHDVLEVMAMVSLVHTPDSPPEVLGFANRRGQMIPIIDLRRVFGHPGGAVGVETLFIVVQHMAQQAGLVVDTINEVQYIDLEAVETPIGSGRYIHGIMNFKEHLLQIITIPPLLAAFLPQEGN